MLLSNFIPSGPAKHLRQIKYTDGTPSREVEDKEPEETEVMKEFREGFAYRKKPSVIDIRDSLCNLYQLIDAISAGLMAEPPYTDPQIVYNVLQINVIPKLKELEQELAKL